MTGTAQDAVHRAPGSPVRAMPTLPPVPTPGPHVRLTETEAAILELLAAGDSNRRICTQLYLAQPTVDYHLARLRRKLHAESRVAIVSRAYALGILRPAEWPPRVRPPAGRLAVVSA
jgi:DNA-binding CsgD family transcriptional regulator